MCVVCVILRRLDGAEESLSNSGLMVLEVLSLGVESGRMTWTR